MELKNGTLGVYLGVDPHTPDPRDYNWTLIHSVDQGIMEENIRLKKQIDELLIINKNFNSFTLDQSNVIQALNGEILTLKQTVSELHTRSHELIENQSKIEQKARTQQRQYDAKVYAYWKKKAETLASKVFFLENEVKKTEILQKIVSKLMDRVVNRSKKLIAIKQILDGSSESRSE